MTASLKRRLLLRVVVLGALSAAFAGRGSESVATTSKSEKLPCYGQTTAPPADFTVVLGVVALPATPRAHALQTTLTYGGERFRLFAKTGLWYKGGKRFELSVPANMVDQFAIGWGGPGVPRPFAYSDACAGMSREWVAVPGGYWVSETMCVPLKIRVGSRMATVRIGIGTPCAGQAPPVGATES